MESHFEINVALNGQHFMKVVLPSTTTLQDAKIKLTFLRLRFGESFVCTMTRWEVFGHDVKVNE